MEKNKGAFSIIQHDDLTVYADFVNLTVTAYSHFRA